MISEILSERRKRSRFIYVVLFSASIIYFSGCGAIHRARSAQNKNTIPPGERTVTASEAGISAGAELTLEQAVQIALSYHPSMIQAKQNLAIAQAQYKSAIYGFLPSSPVSAGAKRATSNAEPLPESNRAKTTYSANIGVDWVLFDFGKTPALVKQAYQNRIAAEKTVQTTAGEIEYDVSSAYFNLINAQALLKVAEDAVHQYQTHLDQARALAEVGRRIVAEVTKVEVDLGNAKLDLLKAQNSVVTARAGLNQAMGLAECPEYVVVEPSMRQYSPNVENLMAAARERNPEIQALIAEEKAAHAAINAAIGALAPTLSLGAGRTWSGTEFPLTWNWYIGPSINWNPFGLFKGSAYLDQMTAGLRIARSKRAARDQALYLELSKAVAQFETAQKRMDLAKLILKQAQQNLELVGERYRVGKVSVIELTDAQTSLISAESEGANAAYDYQIALAQIRKIVGGELP